MVTFLKNAKKFLDLKNANEAYHALHYVGGRVYASSPQTLIWLEEGFDKRGSYDFMTGKKLDVRMPDFEMVIPQVGPRSCHALFDLSALVRLRAVLKGIVTIDGALLDVTSVHLDWSMIGLVIRVQTPTLVIEYKTGAATRDDNLRDNAAYVNARLFANMIDYFVQQRRTHVGLFAPLSESWQSPLLFYAAGTGGVLTQVCDETSRED